MSKKNNKTRSHFYWLGGGLLAVIVVLMMSSHHATSIKQKNLTGIVSTDYSASLNANLARLRALENQKTAAIQKADGEATSIVVPAHSKAYLARQNAPTSMYSNPEGSIVSDESKKSIQQVTFAEQGINAQFSNSGAVTSTVQASSIPHPDFTVASGEFLHAVLETAINSDLPGMVRAIVSQPAYSYEGSQILIPAGSRLIGQYNSAVIQGQNRVMVIWNRVILPNGIAIEINSPGTDAVGRAGQGAGSVNTHFFARFGESALLSLIGAGTATVGVNDNDQYNSASQYRMAIAQSFQQSAQQSLQGSLPMKPTLHVHQGTNINVFVTRDLSFYHALKQSIHLPQPLPSFVK